MTTVSFVKNVKTFLEIGEKLKSLKYDKQILKDYMWNGDETKHYHSIVDKNSRKIYKCKDEMYNLIEKMSNQIIVVECELGIK